LKRAYLGKGPTGKGRDLYAWLAPIKNKVNKDVGGLIEVRWKFW
jgi:hypothetical protein